MGNFCCAIANVNEATTTIVMPSSTVSITATYKKTPTGLSSINANKILIYPNPAVNNVVISNINNAKSIKLTNITGQVLIHKRVNNKSINLDVSKLNRGLYIIHIYFDNGYIVNKRIVIE